MSDITPQMRLILPIVGETRGNEWARLLNMALTKIDLHDHSNGFGAPISQRALVFTDDLNMNGYGIKNSTFLSMQENNLSRPIPNQSFYFQGDEFGRADLYLKISDAKTIRLTLNGDFNAGLVGAIGGDYVSTNASVFYDAVSGAYVFLRHDPEESSSTSYADLHVQGTNYYGDESWGSVYSVGITAPSNIIETHNLMLPPAPADEKSVITIMPDGTMGYRSDANIIGEAPEDNREWVRRNGVWVINTGGSGFPEAPSNNIEYVRKNDDWFPAVQVVDYENTIARLSDLSSPHILSGGVMEEGSTPTEVSVASGVVRFVDPLNGKLKDYNVPARVLDLVSATETNYIIAQLNNELNTVTWEITGNIFLLSADPVNNILLGACISFGHVLETTYGGNNASRFTSKFALKQAVQGWFEHGLGCFLASSGMQISTTYGAFYQGVIDYDVPPLNSNPDGMTLWYKDNTGWVSNFAMELDRANYNEVNVGLTALTVDNYSSHWIYLIIADSGAKLHVVYGDKNNITSLDDALNDELPAELPPFTAKYSLGILLGRVITRTSNTEAERVQTAFVDALSTQGAINDHNSLAGVQGGQAGDRQHITSAEVLKIEQADILEPSVIPPAPEYIGQTFLESSSESAKRWNGTRWVTNVDPSQTVGEFWIPPTISEYYTQLQLDLEKTTVDSVLDVSFNDLADTYSDYVSKSQIGTSQADSHPIYQYTFTPARYEKTIIVSCLVHGNEYESYYWASYFFRRLCERPNTSSQFNYLRHNVRIIVLPMVNPWGFFKQIRQNARGVDLNRNFPYRWDDFLSDDLASDVVVSSNPNSRLIVATGVSWETDAYRRRFIHVTEGTGAGTYAFIENNSADTITLFENADLGGVELDGTSRFRILHGNYKGDTVTSEAESIALKDVLDTEVTATAYVDFHTIISVDAHYIIFTPRYVNTPTPEIENLMRYRALASDRFVHGTSTVPTPSNYSAETCNMLSCVPEFNTDITGTGLLSPEEMFKITYWFSNLIFIYATTKGKVDALNTNAPQTRFYNHKPETAEFVSVNEIHARFRDGRRIKIETATVVDMCYGTEGDEDTTLYVGVKEAISNTVYILRYERDKGRVIADGEDIFRHYKHLIPTVMYSYIGKRPSAFTNFLAEDGNIHFLIAISTDTPTANAIWTGSSVFDNRVLIINTYSHDIHTTNIESSYTVRGLARSTGSRYSDTHFYLLCDRGSPVSKLLTVLDFPSYASGSFLSVTETIHDLTAAMSSITGRISKLSIIEAISLNSRYLFFSYEDGGGYKIGRMQITRDNPVGVPTVNIMTYDDVDLVVGAGSNISGIAVANSGFHMLLIGTTRKCIYRVDLETRRDLNTCSFVRGDEKFLPSDGTLQTFWTSSAEIVSEGLQRVGLGGSVTVTADRDTRIRLTARIYQPYNPKSNTSKFRDIYSYLYDKEVDLVAGKAQEISLTGFITAVITNRNLGTGNVYGSPRSQLITLRISVGSLSGSTARLFLERMQAVLDLTPTTRAVNVVMYTSDESTVRANYTELLEDGESHMLVYPDADVDNISDSTDITEPVPEPEVVEPEVDPED